MDNTISDKMLTAKEISEIMGITKQAIIARAKKENWTYIIKEGNGGKTKKYPLSSLPSDVQEAIVHKDGVNPEMLPALKPAAASAMISRHIGSDEYLANCDMTKALDAISTNGRGYDPETAIREQDMTDPRIAKILGILREVDAIPRDWSNGKRKWIEAVAMRHAVQWQSIYRWMKKYE
ncbi:MAG: DNA-binding protein, partial [Smithella sp.]